MIRVCLRPNNGAFGCSSGDARTTTTLAIYGAEFEVTKADAHWDFRGETRDRRLLPHNREVSPPEQGPVWKEESWAFRGRDCGD